MFLSLILQAAPDFSYTLGDLQKQGPVFSVLVLAIWYFYTQGKQQALDIKAATDKLEAYMSEDRRILIEALNNNTRVMQEMEIYLKAKMS